jgi:hypothetical protein
VSRSLTVNCMDCDQTWDMPIDMVSEGIQAEQVRTERGHYGSIKYFGICETCQAKHRRADPFQEDEFVKLFRLRDEFRAANADWSVEQAAAAAVRLMNDPWAEPNIAFRHYLVSVESEFIV